MKRQAISFYPEDQAARAALAAWQRAEQAFREADPAVALSTAARVTEAEEAFRDRLASARAVRGLPSVTRVVFSWQQEHRKAN